MGSRYHKQEQVRLTIGGGDWLLVRKHLTAGEERGAQAKLIKAGTFVAGGGRPQMDPEEVGIAEAVAYLLDWSITDADDKPIVIRDQPYEFVAAALKGMSIEGLQEILDAIKAHDHAMAAERAHEKKVRAGESAPAPTSTSVG